MKQILLVLNGLLLVTSVTPKVVITNCQASNQEKEWHLQSKKYANKLEAGQWGYFAIDNINLSKMNIKSIDDLHSYEKIEIPNLKITYGTITAVVKDTWNPKFRQLGSEDWKPMFYRNFNNFFKISLESAATLWYSNSGDLMMRLAYHASMRRTVSSHVHVGGIIFFETGSLIKIY